jgi:acyl-coenzyme A thioesterase PaaI-like protein
MQNPDATFMAAFIADPTPRPMATSPLLELLNAEALTWEADARRITMRFSPPPAFRQGAGLIQGGIIGTMLDFAMVLPAFSALSDFSRSSRCSAATSHSLRAAARRFSVSASLSLFEAARKQRWYMP